MNFFRYINKLLNRLLILVGLRRGQEYWGVVYDSRSKQPLDPAVVKLIRVETGEVTASCVTDITGRYGFLAPRGKYKILVKKTNYTFPSSKVFGNSDGVFSNIYRGEFFTLEGEAAVIPFNIPMDPAGQDWNQSAKSKFTNFFPFFEQLLSRIVSILFWFVFILAGFRMLTAPSVFVEGIMVFYGLVLSMAFLLPHNRLWGQVLDSKTGILVPGAAICLSHAKIPDIVVAKATASGEGRFFLRAEPGRYLLQVKQTDRDGREKILKSARFRVGSEGLINNDIWV